jgi:hypothetical protein
MRVDASMPTTLICMMAKAPEPGRVKTRLALPPETAAALADAFIDDTWRAIGSSADLRALAFSGAEEALPPCVAGALRWRQRGADLGARIEHTLHCGLERADRVIVTGSDSPGLPPTLLATATAALDDHDAVIGPAIDGGYYLIGMRRCESDLFTELPWSQADTRQATVDRLAARGYSIALLPTWFDVDDDEGLELLRRALAAGLVDAPATARTLSTRLPPC